MNMKDKTWIAVMSNGGIVVADDFEKAVDGALFDLKLRGMTRDYVIMVATDAEQSECKIFALFGVRVQIPDDKDMKVFNIKIGDWG